MGQPLTNHRLDDEGTVLCSLDEDGGDPGFLSTVTLQRMCDKPADTMDARGWPVCGDHSPWGCRACSWTVSGCSVCRPRPALEMIGERDAQADADTAAIEAAHAAGAALLEEPQTLGQQAAQTAGELMGHLAQGALAAGLVPGVTHAFGVLTELEEAEAQLRSILPPDKLPEAQGEVAQRAERIARRRGETLGPDHQLAASRSLARDISAGDW
jgi:hypothetical protein